MIKHDVVQGTLDWHELRNGKICGTDSNGLFVDSETLFIKIISENMEDFELEDTYTSYSMEQGKEREPYARLELSAELFINFQEVGFLQNSSIPILGISPDGLSPCETEGCETKCLTKKEHAKIILSNEIPKKHIPQCLHYFTVNPKLKKLHFASYRPENKVKSLWYKTLTLDTLLDMGQTEKIKIKSDKGKGLKEYVETVNIVKPISEWVKIARLEAEKIDKKVKETLSQLYDH